MTLSRGQMVLWSPAPGGVAQIDELRRTRVRLVYFARTGRMRRPVVPANRVRPDPSSLFTNLFGRGVLPQSKQYPPNFPRIANSAARPQRIST